MVALLSLPSAADSDSADPLIGRNGRPNLAFLVVRRIR
jgi:hypothetical protein